MESREKKRKRSKPKRRRSRKKKKRAVRVRPLERRRRGIEKNDRPERRRHPRRPRRPRPAPPQDRRPKLDLELSPERQREIDAFLARVYQHAAREMAEPLGREREEHDQAEVLERYARARASIIAALRASEARQKR